MMKLALALAVSACAAFGQYKMEPAGAVPADVPAPFGSLMQDSGAKILNASGAVFCEVWFRKSLPSGPKTTEDAVSLPTIPHGTLLGILRFPGNGADRRGQPIKPGTYTLRYAWMPVNGDHLGAAPQRDFVLMTPIAEDKDPNATPKFEDVVAMSRKASGTAHPAVLSISPSSASSFPSFGKEAEHDWTLNVKLGDQSIAIILVGKAEG